MDLINYFGLNILTLINYLACEEVKFGPNLIKYFRGSWSKDFDFRPLYELPIHKFSSAVMAQSVPKGLLASLHADRLLRGERYAKTAPLPMSAADHEVSGVATNQASP